MLVVFKLGIIKSKGLFIDITLVVMPVMFVISGVWCILRKGQGRAFQYIFLVMLAVFWLELELMSGYKCKLLLPVLTVLSLRYYNRKFTIFTYVVCVFAMLASVFCNAYLYDVTGFIDLNLISFDESFHEVLRISYDSSLNGFIHKSIIDLRPSSEMLLRNGLLITFFPNMIFLTFTVLLTIRFMRYNLANIIKAENIAMREANQRVELADMKTKMLLSQIKPYFIYNTLTTIAYFCTEAPEKAENLTNCFTEYLRNNISSLSDTERIPFTKELDAIKNYFKIEKYRFEDRVNIMFDIHAEDFVVPVLSIQPIVENAVKHGICKKKGGGTIWLTTEESESESVITVRDDGVGFDKDAIASDGKEHVGIRNITTRIENAGGTISFESRVNVGTTVTIRLPKGEEIC